MLCFSIPHSTCIKKIRNKTKNFSENEANRKLNIESFFLVNSAKTLGTPSAPHVQTPTPCRNQLLVKSLDLVWI